MELSSTLKKNARALGVSDQYMIMADLMSIGYSESDAYLVAHPESQALSVQSCNTRREAIVKTQKFKKLLADSKERLAKKIKEPLAGELELIDDNAVAKEVLYSAYQQPVGSKERAELFTRYREIVRASEQVAGDKGNAIDFYLPLCCDKCPLMIEWKEKTKKRKEANNE